MKKELPRDVTHHHHLPPVQVWIIASEYRYLKLHEPGRWILGSLKLKFMTSEEGGTNTDHLIISWGGLVTDQWLFLVPIKGAR